MLLAYALLLSAAPKMCSGITSSPRFWRSDVEAHAMKHSVVHRYPGGRAVENQPDGFFCLQRPFGLSFGQYTLQNTFSRRILWLKFCSYLSFLCPALTAPRVETKLFGRPAASSGSAWSDLDI